MTRGTAGVTTLESALRGKVARRTLLAVLAAGAAVTGLCLAAMWTSTSNVSTPADLYAQFCTPVPAAAVVADSIAADRRIDVVVPRSVMAPELDGESHATRIMRGEVVEFSIVAPIAGAASVHGLSDLVLMKPGERATLRFKAVYGGRFPLHFHGVDGSHYGVWALNISNPPS